MTKTQWAKDMNTIDAALTGHTFEVDGHMFIDTSTAPADAVRMHKGLVSIGYANGFFA